MRFKRWQLQMYKIFLMISLMVMNNIIANEVCKKLDKRMVVASSLVCVGLDPDITKMPNVIKNSNAMPEDKIYLFLTQIVEITAPHACSFKIQKAFFDQLDLGHVLLKRIISYIRAKFADIPIFIDCKIGDTDNTMKAYMHLMFEDFKADSVVINPYMGDDVLEPFMQDKNKSAIVLIQTSNPSAKVVQELKLANGKKLWEEMLKLVLTRWNVNKNLILVLSGNTDASNYKYIRKFIPQDTPILLAGIGLQGGDPEVMKQLLNDDKRGVFVNSSRGILYSYDSEDEEWKNSVLNAVIELKNTLNDIRSDKSDLNDDLENIPVLTDKELCDLKLEKLLSFKFKKDAYQEKRGEPVMLVLFCNTCGCCIMGYQKDGPGPLLRCYLDRIVIPDNLEKLQYIAVDKQESTKLKCGHCNVCIGDLTIYQKENRPAYELDPNSFKIKKLKDQASL